MAGQKSSKKSLIKLSPRVQHFLTQLHVSLYRRTKGRLAGGNFLLVLTTVGRKSGQERDTPLFFFRDEGSFVVIASNGGSERIPSWWFNLKSRPQATVQVDGQVIPVKAHEAEGDERDRLWAIIEENYKLFPHYQEKVNRRLPVVVLVPITPGS